MPALLVGPSSTGKTMAAAWPATGLGLPLYRVDLAAAISKYIGETEKNLAELLAHAESAEVILLLDFPIPRPEERLLLWQPRVGARHPAEFFGMQQTLGTVQVGKTADLVLLDANPLDRISNTQAIRAVVAGGRLFTRRDLDGLLQTSAAAAGKVAVR